MLGPDRFGLCPHAWLHGNCPFCQVDLLKRRLEQLLAVHQKLQEAHDLAVGDAKRLRLEVRRLYRHRTVERREQAGAASEQQ